MIKRIVILFLLLLLPVSVFAAYEFTESATVKAFNGITRDIIINREGDANDYLLSYFGNCGSNIEVGGKVKLLIDTELDAKKDYVRESFKKDCIINRFEQINNTARVDYIYADDSTALVTSADGDRYRVVHGTECSGMPYHDNIYLNQATTSIIAKGDTMFMPSKGFCTIRYIEKLSKIEPKQFNPDVDRMKPSIVNDVKAMPGDASVYLEWDASTDDVEIDHYIVSTSEYSLDTENYRTQDMPNQATVEGLKYKSENLKNNTIYFFYILAVDTSNNESAEWSHVSSTTPQGSIVEGFHSAPYEVTPLSLKLVSETAKSYLFRWDRVDGAVRYSVVLESEHRKLYSHYNWYKPFIRILKKDERRNIPLSLKVRASGNRFHEEQTIEFSF